MPEALKATAAQRRALMRQAEAASLAMPVPDLLAAQRRFLRQRDAAFRMALAREIAQTRGRELTLAYRNVVMVAAGWRQKRNGKGQALRRPEPCVVLFVKRKQMPAQAEQVLPQHLLIGAEQGGRRLLFAVPTDVQEATQLVGSHARGAQAVDVSDPVAPAFGTVCCAVKLQRADNSPAEVMMLSAMHVFTPFPDVNVPPSALAARVSPVGQGGLLVGSTTPQRGQLVDADLGFSFDAQLARVQDPAWLRQQLAGQRLSGKPQWLADVAAFDTLVGEGAAFELCAADNHPGHGAVQIRLGFATSDLSALPLAYKVRLSPPGGPAQPGAPIGTVGIKHWDLLHFDVLGPDFPMDGDSGSAVLCRTADGAALLAGMFIGCSLDRRHAFMLPAWQLFQPANWNDSGAGLPGIKSLRPVNP
nr:hypothetical protein [uncultured Roseateles sp.]